MDIGGLKAPYQIIQIDPWLAPHAGDIELRMDRFKEKRWQLVGGSPTLEQFANGYLFFGFHRTKSGWVFREWMPGADEVRLFGEFNDWDRESHPLDRGENGVWEIALGADALQNGQKVKYFVSPKATDGQQLYKSLCTISDHYGAKFAFCNKQNTGQTIVDILSGKDVR